jgi:hypothetical protein
MGGRFEICFPDDDPLWDVIQALPAGTRSRAVREAMRAVLLGPPAMRALAEAFGQLAEARAASPSVPVALREAAPSAGPTPLDEFLATLER